MYPKMPGEPPRVAPSRAKKPAKDKPAKGAVRRPPKQELANRAHWAEVTKRFAESLQGLKVDLPYTLGSANATVRMGSHTSFVAEGARSASKIGRAHV